MDLFLRGPSAHISAQAPLWLTRLCGAMLALAVYLVADQLGLGEVTGAPSLLMAPGALLLGAAIAPTRAGIAMWWLLALVSITTLAVAFTPVVQGPALHYVRRDNGAPPVDAVVVLSGSMTEDGLLAGPVVNRLLSGIAEARRRGIPTIAISVIERRSGGRVVSTEADQRALLSRLAPDLTVRTVRDVHSTHDEALQFAALARTYGWQRVVLVSSPLHTRRACRTFEVAGLAVVCTPADAREYSLTRLGGVHARMNAFRDVMYETAATSFYALRGWI